MNTRRARSARTRSRTATAAASRAPRPPTTSTSTTRASRSPRARGDDGYGVEYPAASRYVTAVGGTSLDRATATRAAGPRPRGAAPAAAARATRRSRRGRPTPAARRRTVADVSAVADPNTGVAVYDSYGSGARLVHGSAARARPRRSSPASTRSPATPSSVDLRLVPVRAHDRRCSTSSSGSNGTCSPGVPLHRRAPATTARPGSARRTAPRASSSFSAPRVPACAGALDAGWQRPPFGGTMRGCRIAVNCRGCERSRSCSWCSTTPGCRSCRAATSGSTSSSSSPAT